MTAGDTLPSAEDRPLPTWTGEQLAVVLSVLFGVNKRGGPDTAAAATALEVSRRSVQRWLRSGTGGAVRMSKRHLEQVRDLAVPDDVVRRDEERAAAYARDALERIALPKGRGVLPAWRDQQWLDQHLVTVIDLHLGLRQISLTRVTSRTQQRGERTRAGTLLDFCVVATRFHAQLLVHAVLTEVQPWRVRGRARAPRQGASHTWLPDAPHTDLSAMAVAHGLR
ncbi:hypothetical protein [Klenkia sp. PcliD-1-E]|uniref:hypothetical protein n=1 Tax=Klenkia sp. PcliD-1-E TaxID=2954492 RepID=UPI00209731D6|nr:hypothetical protein [Klenkia sp. PcliD-1-E]MCO7221536.1 hypothetical protein [Klenkia sp. PcliD-1-E]